MTELSTPSKPKVAVAAAVLVGAVLYVVASLAGGGYGGAFFTIPVFIGFVSGALSPKRPFIGPLYAMVVSLFLAVITLREGVVCVLFALPVVVPGVLLGGFSGSVIVNHVRSRRAQRYTLGAMIFAGIGVQIIDGALADPASHPRHVAEASVVVDASPDEVFALLTTGEMRVAPHWPWFLRIGLPMPERMLVEKPGPNGAIRFDFSQGTAFADVTAWRPGQELRYAVRDYAIRDLPFHITRLGRSPDYGFRSERVQDWLTIDDTRYRFVPAEGGTRVTRRIVWRRHLAPDVYFSWLQQTVMERGQIRLLELIRDRASERRRSGEQTAPTALLARPATSE